MVLAELEVFHSRAVQPTRRVALGHLVLPVDPAPGLGGILLGAVVAEHSRRLDGDDLLDIGRLITEVEQGRRVPQPRLRHRYQVDRHGLACSRHVMHGEGDDISFDLETRGTDVAQVLGAIYALERLDLEARQAIGPVLTRASRWRGPIGPSLVAHLAGARSTELRSLADPRGWAMTLLGFDPDDAAPSRREVMRRYRRRMLDVHPDHGGDSTEASASILELNEARRILTELPVVG